MQALPSLPNVVASSPEPKPRTEGQIQAKAKPETHSEAEPVAPKFDPDLDPSNIIPVNLPGPGPQEPPALLGVQPVMHWSDHIVIDRYGPPLRTDRCCECNAEADRTIQKNYSSLGGNFLVRALSVSILRLRERCSDAPDKFRVPVEFGMCERCANRRMVRLSLGLAGLISSGSFFVQALISGGLASVIWIIVGFALLVAGALTTIAATRLGIPKRIDNRWIILKAGSPEFREGLTQSPIPLF